MALTCTVKRCILYLFNLVPYSFPATILRSWPDNGDVRMEMLCVFAITEQSLPNTKMFVMEFDTEVTKFEVR